MLASRQGEEIDYPRFRDLELRNPDIYTSYTYLFSIDGQGYYLLEHVTIPTPSRFSMENTEIFRDRGPAVSCVCGITDTSSTAGTATTVSAGGVGGI